MAVETTTMTISLLTDGVSYIPTQVTSTTVGELREELGLGGQIILSQEDAADVIAADVTELQEGMRLSHVPTGMKGGKDK
tara:strand:+ start:282 stop:521 length:240 start_codon:yes stop_codon:yes gene_type:complete